MVLVEGLLQPLRGQHSAPPRRDGPAEHVNCQRLPWDALMRTGAMPVKVVFQKIAGSDRITILLAALLVVFGTTLVHLAERAIRLVESNVMLQFRELEGAFGEHGRFLLGWKLHDNEIVGTPDGVDTAASASAVSWAQISSSSDASEPPTELAQSFIEFYRDFWLQSRYRPSQCLLVNGRGTQGILVPSKYDSKYQRRGVPTQLRSALERIRDAVLSRPRLKTGYVAWTEEPWIDGQTRFVAVTSAPEDAAQWGEVGENNVPAIACLMETDGLLSNPQVSGTSDVTQLTLFTPAGTRLIGDPTISRNGPSRRLGLRGLEVRIEGREGWTAVYSVSLRQLLVDEYGTLAAGGVLACVVGLSSTALLRARRRNILQELRIHDERLRESQEFSRAFLESAPIGVCLLRRHDGHVLLDNVRARRFLGGDHEHGGWQGKWRQEVLGAEAEQDIAYTTPENRHLTVSVTEVRFDGEDALLCLFVDVTLQRITEQAMHDAQAAAETANQAKSQFLAMISHEIRTPLYGVLGTLELLGLTTLETRQREYLRTVEASSSTLMHLLDDILDISKAEAGQLQLDVGNFSPAHLTEDVVMAWNGAAQRKGLTFYAIIDAQAPATISGDAARIRQILNNLLSNAIKFTEHGRIVMRLIMKDVAGNRLICWQVSDSGIGIPAEAQTRLFERFYQVDPSNHGKQGTGLGLTICTLLSEMMGGSIAVTSEPGLGSSFTLEIPLNSANQEPSQPPATPWPLTVPLLVRGEPQTVVRNIIDRLEARGIKAVLAGDLHLSSPHDSTPLLDILLSSTTEPGAWNGPHVVATHSAGEQPELADGCWQVTAHRLDAIVEAVLLAKGIGSNRWVTHSREAVRNLDLTILVAEDNPVNQAILRDQLEQLGCRSVIAADGREALGYCGEQPFSLLLTDLHMPVMDGFALASALRERGFSLRIVGTTANADPAERERCRLAGMDGLLVKPIALKDLQSVLLDVPLMGTPDQPKRAALSPATSADAALQSLEPLVVPPRHRTLFLQTMSEDAEQLREAIARRSATKAVALLHRICGALTIAGTSRLVELGASAEDALAQSPDLATGWEGAERFLAMLAESLRSMSSQAP